VRCGRSRRRGCSGASVATGALGGDFSTWDDTFRLALGNTAVRDRAFVGELHLAAIYARALSAAEVKQNFDAGPDP
jgi:hypothetical protein